jgi:large subunit ribosomal protein L4
VKTDVFKINGTKTGAQATLPSKIFGIDPNEHAIWLAVTAEMANRRHGNAATKNRSAVRGGGRKPWRQKGRGTARAGTIRSPLWVGGGRIFGPSPRCYTKRMTKKMGKLARKSALSFKAKEEKIRLVEDFIFESPKTRQMLDILKNFQLHAVKTLLLVPEANRSILLSCRNLPLLSVKESACFSTYDVVDAEMILIQKSALTKINEVLGK